MPGRRRGSLPMVGVGSPQGGARHGLPLSAIEAMRESQDNMCAICLSTLPPVPEVDHDHSLAKMHGHDPRTGCRRCVRALLCGDCNTMLGRAKDQPERLETGAKYLRLWRALLKG